MLNIKALINPRLLLHRQGPFSRHWKGCQFSVTYTENDPSSFNLAFRVQQWATKKPSSAALCIVRDHRTEPTYVSYEDLFTNAQLLSMSLMEGQSRPSCALVMLPKVPAWWIINVAGAWAGFTVSPGVLMLSEKDIKYRLEQCKADTIFCDIATMHKVSKLESAIPWKIVVGASQEEEERCKREGWLSFHSFLKKRIVVGAKFSCRPDAVAQLFFTSGTTGYPKMVPHCHDTYYKAQLYTARHWLDLQEDDVVWNFSDLGWAKAAWASLYHPLISGCTVFVHQMPRFDPAEVLTTLEKFPVTVCCAPPMVYRALVQCNLSGFKPKALRHCASAGETLGSEVFHTWKENIGLSICEGYGQSETGLVCGTLKNMDPRPGSVGKATIQYDVRILDDDLKEVTDMEVGQLAISLARGWPDGLFKGYLNAPEKNAASFVGGFYLTGDKAYKDKDGYLWFVGRHDDIIQSSGYRIGPYEVESVLHEHPAVAECAVVQAPNRERGNIVKAFVVLSEMFKDHEDLDSLKNELQDHVKRNTAPYKYPREIDFVSSLPKTVSGKIRRVELREKELQKYHKTEQNTVPQ